MIPETILNTLLSADAQVTALVDARIYPGRLPKGQTVPALVYRRIDVLQLHRPLAVTAQAFTLNRARMRVGVLTAADRGYVTAQTLMQHVRRVVGNQVGAVAGYAGTHIGPALVAPEQDDDEAGIAVDAMDFMVTYREPV